MPKEYLPLESGQSHIDSLKHSLKLLQKELEKQTAENYLMKDER